MADLNGFDASQVEPASFEPIPAGKYVAVITDSAMKPTKSGTGEYLECKFQIIEGEHRGRLLWSRLNLRNPSNQAQEIARQELSAICRAVEVMKPRDSVDLHNLPLVISVKLKKRDDNGELTNEISGYFKREAAGPPPPTQSQPQSTPPAPQPGGNAHQVPTTPPYARPEGPTPATW